MKKVYLIFVLTVGFLFTNCDLDGNFGVKVLYSTHLVIDDIEFSEVRLYCKSEKIGISSLIECDDRTNDEESLGLIQRNKIVDNYETFKLFYIPSIPDIDDRNNINIHFEAEVENEEYVGDLFISKLQESSYSLFTEPVCLKTQEGKRLKAKFVYRFWRSI